MARSLTTAGKLLGVAAFFQFLAALLFISGGSDVLPLPSYWTLIVPLVGVPATFWALFYVYRNRPLGIAGILWVFGLAFFWLALLPVFWYLKVYRAHARAT